MTKQLMSKRENMTGQLSLVHHTICLTVKAIAVVEICLSEWHSNHGTVNHMHVNHLYGIHISYFFPERLLEYHNLLDILMLRVELKHQWNTTAPGSCVGHRP